MTRAIIIFPAERRVHSLDFNGWCEMPAMTTDGEELLISYYYGWYRFNTCSMPSAKLVQAAC